MEYFSFEKVLGQLAQNRGEEGWRNTEFCVHKPIQEFCETPWNFAVLYSKKFVELRKIKSIPYKILYSVEFQKGTSENTLVVKS